MSKKIKLARINHEQVASEIGNFMIQQIVRCGRVGGVIGLSGGVDSTTTAALAKRAFDIYNTKYENKLELVGYILPSATNSHNDERDGKNVAERLGIRYEIISIQPVVEACKSSNPETFKSNFHKGNLMAEIRAVILHQKAATENKLVIGTGNRDEDFSIAYYTLYGDGAVHLSPIGNLPKRLVREMARYIDFSDVADRIPTAGLEIGQTDFKDLGYEYETAELVIEGISQKFSLDELVRDNQVIEHVRRDIEEYERLFGRKKFSSVEEIVQDIAFRNRVAKAKAKILHPPVAPVTLDYDKNNKEK